MKSISRSVFLLALIPTSILAANCEVCPEFDDSLQYYRSDLKTHSCADLKVMMIASDEPDAQYCPAFDLEMFEFCGCIL